MRRRARASMLVLAALVPLVLVTAGVAHADWRDEAWRRGNEAYLHGDYAGAAAAYEELEHQGVVSADLSSIWVTPIFARGRWGRQSGRLRRPPRSILATRTPAITSAKRARWPRGRRTTGSRVKIAIRSGSAP